MSEDNGIDNYTQDDYQKALAKLKQVSPLQPGYSTFIGHSQEGRAVWFPGSYLAGYTSILHNTQLAIVSDFLGLGIVGQLSDGTWAYLPSFRNGRAKAINDLRMAAMAQAHLRTFAEIEEIKRRQEEQRRKDEREKQELHNKINSLQEELSKLKEGKKSEGKKQD